VRDIGLKEARDPEIWESAREDGYTVLTADEDFVALSQRRGWPPKVIHIAQCDFPFRVIEDLLRRNAVRISGFERDSKVGILVLRVKQCVTMATSATRRLESWTEG
jgi:predicted nuclease of predicted toxin-antitoxin system